MRRRSAPSRTPSTTSKNTAPPDTAGERREGRAAALAERLALPISNLSLLEEALVHSSYPNDHPAEPIRSNDRLEFLGDAVIGLIFSEALFVESPDDDEGVLTARRARLVSSPALARLATRIGLGEYLLLGEGAERARERRRPTVLESAFEALVGAIYLDRGYAQTRQWLLAVAEPELADRPAPAALKSAKSRLLEAMQALTGRPPTYRVVSATGPDHARWYVVEAILGDEVLGAGGGRSRRAAEMQAAETALVRLAGPEPAVAEPASAEPTPAEPTGRVN
jgi:ribonuclease III